MLKSGEILKWDEDKYFVQRGDLTFNLCELVRLLGNVISRLSLHDLSWYDVRYMMIIIWKARISYFTPGQCYQTLHNEKLCMRKSEHPKNRIWMTKYLKKVVIWTWHRATLDFWGLRTTSLGELSDCSLCGSNPRLEFGWSALLIQHGNVVCLLVLWVTYIRLD